MQNYHQALFIFKHFSSNSHIIHGSHQKREKKIKNVL